MQRDMKEEERVVGVWGGVVLHSGESVGWLVGNPI